MPAAPDAVMAAYEWLRANGSERIAFVGDSAGGGLSLVTLARLAHTSRPSVAIAGVVFSPWVDLAFTGASMKDAHMRWWIATFGSTAFGAYVWLMRPSCRRSCAAPPTPHPS